MLTFLLAKIAIEALVMCLILYVVARHEADYSFQKVFMVAAGTSLGNVLIDVAFYKYLGAFVILPKIGFIIFINHPSINFVT